MTSRTGNLVPRLVFTSPTTASVKWAESDVSFERMLEAALMHQNPSDIGIQVAYATDPHIAELLRALIKNYTIIGVVHTADGAPTENWHDVVQMTEIRFGRKNIFDGDPMAAGDSSLEEKIEAVKALQGYGDEPRGAILPDFIYLSDSDKEYLQNITDTAHDLNVASAMAINFTKQTCQYVTTGLELPAFDTENPNIREALALAVCLEDHVVQLRQELVEHVNKTEPPRRSTVRNAVIAAAPAALIELAALSAAGKFTTTEIQNHKDKLPEIEAYIKQLESEIHAGAISIVTALDQAAEAEKQTQGDTGATMH